MHSADRHEDGKEYDALRVLALEMVRSERDKWPELLFLLGDQVYVDEGSPRTRERIRERRGTGTPPGDEVTDFEEYSWLYVESWSDPMIRWLFSTVSVSMLWDDHDMSDDWNISCSWVEEMGERSWWHGRAASGIMSYWIYQHLGNLSPRALDEDELYGRVRGSERATSELRRFAAEIDSTGSGSRWSYCRDLGNTRAIFMDSRAGRVLKEGERSIFDEEEWEWIVEQASGDFDHLLISTTVPFLLSPGFHYLEAWSERVCDGAWGGLAARGAEQLRRAVDFDHWASFDKSFQLTARPARRGRLRQARQGAGLDRRPLRRRPPRLPGRDRLPARCRDGERRLPGRLLALPQPARRPRATGDQGRLHAAPSSPRCAAWPAGRRVGSRSALAPRRGPLLRQPGRDPAPRRAQGRDAARQDGPRRGGRAPP